MEQPSLNLDYGALYERIHSVPQLRAAFKAVKRNHGAPGIDGVTIEEFESDLSRNLRDLSQELRDWRYRPQPLRRKRIPKPGTSKERILGIPSVRDRIVHFSIKISLEPILEPTFSDSSYGYRPGRSQGDAVERVRRLVGEGRPWVVDLDLRNFFDTINHDRIINLLKEKVADKRVLRLIGLILRSGVMEGGKRVRTSKGVPQGSPLSPLLGNLVLDELDTELERRGLVFCRYADDSNILVGSRKAAERVLRSVSRFIERKLKLQVNWDKSRVARSEAVKFLGMTIVTGLAVISVASMRRALDTVRELVPRRTHIPLERQVERVNRWYRGWSGYYAMTALPSQLQQVEARIRLRFRLQFVGNHKRRRHLARKLVKRGLSRRRAWRAVSQNRGLWELSHSLAVGIAWPNSWFEQLGLHAISQEVRTHWQSPKSYVKVTRGAVYGPVRTVL